MAFRTRWQTDLQTWYVFKILIHVHSRAHISQHWLMYRQSVQGEREISRQKEICVFSVTQQILKGSHFSSFKLTSHFLNVLRQAYIKCDITFLTSLVFEALTFCLLFIKTTVKHTRINTIALGVIIG